MDSTTFLGVTPGAEIATGTLASTWHMPVAPGLVTGGSFLFGGAALAGVVAAMERVAGRPLVWATAQYLSYARLGESMTIEVVLAAVGKHITQARGVGRVGDREILTVNAALGSRDFEHSATFDVAPKVPPPADIAPREHRHPVAGTIHEKLDQRLVIGRELEQLDGTPSDGRSVMWARIPDVLTGIDAASLAVLGDFVPMGIGQALGVRGGGNSLDNTLRVVRLVPTTWVLLDIRIDAVERGFGHGSVRMFAEDGTLLATASQSCIARLWREPS